MWLYVPQGKKWEWKCDITLKPKMQKKNKNFFFAFLVSNPYNRVSRLPQCVPFFCHTTGTLIIKNKINFYSPWETIAAPRLHNKRPFLKSCNPRFLLDLVTTLYVILKVQCHIFASVASFDLKKCYLRPHYHIIFNDTEHMMNNGLWWTGGLINV